MKIKILYLHLILPLGLFINCNNNTENQSICHLIDCIDGDEIKFIFFKDNQNLLETKPNTEIKIFQNNESRYYNLNTTNNTITLFLSNDSPLTILIDGQQLIMEVSSTFIEGECCQWCAC